MYELISIGSISIDFFFQGESLTFKDDRFQLAVGGKYQADYLYESIGGGGANVAIGGSVNGLNTAVVGKIGNNSFKHAILDELRKSKVSTDLCEYEDDYINISSILLAQNGERSIIHYLPSHKHIILSAEDCNKFTDTKAVYLGNLPDVSLTERESIIHFLKKKQVLTIVNLGVKDCRRPWEQLEKFIVGIDILIVNAHEFAEIVKRKYEEINFNHNLIEAYPILKNTIVIVTDGPNGSYGYDEKTMVHQKAIEPAVIKDSTGCGDGYTSGFIAEYLKSKDIASAMKSGAHYASKILAQVGAN